MKLPYILISALILPGAVWSLTARGASKPEVPPPHVCGPATLDRLPAGIRFELAPDLLAEFDLKSEEQREPASDEAHPKAPAEIYSPEVLKKPITWANGNQTEVTCVAVRSSSAPWKWPRNAAWKLKSVRQHTQATIGSSVGVTRAPKETVYALSLVSRDSQIFSLQCTALEIGHSPWDPKHQEVTIGAFQHLFSDVLHPTMTVDADGAACQPGLAPV